MQTGPGRTECGTVVLPGAGAAVPVKEIPYDYVATFTLSGILGDQHQDVINISIEGAFVATSIGYSFLPTRERKEDPAPKDAGDPPAVRRRRFLSLARANFDIFAKEIERSDPKSFLQLLAPYYGRALFDAGLQPDVGLVECLQHRLCGIDFLYSIIDSGSGRELQNRAIHNIAGLGEPRGERPFRPFAKPMVFMPRSSIRIEIIEQSPGRLYEGGTLYFVLHGYKALGRGTEGA